MKHVVLFVLLGSVAVAAAAQEATGSSVEVRGSQFQVPEQPYPVFPRELEVYTGAYHLSNGERLTIRQAGRRMYASVGTLPAKEIVATGPSEFVALDRQLKMSFRQEAGDMKGELLMAAPRTLGAIAGSDAVRLVGMR